MAFPVAPLVTGNSLQRYGDTNNNSVDPMIDVGVARKAEPVPPSSASLGRNFSPVADENKVQFNGLEAVVLDASKERTESSGPGQWANRQNYNSDKRE